MNPQAPSRILRICLAGAAALVLAAPAGARVMVDEGDSSVVAQYGWGAAATVAKGQSNDLLAQYARVMRPAATLALAVLVASATLLAQDRPPRDAKATRRADLVEIATLDPTIKLDIRYATTNNFMSTVFYRSRGPSCSARPPRRCCGSTAG